MSALMRCREGLLLTVICVALVPGCVTKPGRWNSTNLLSTRPSTESLPIATNVEDISRVIPASAEIPVEAGAGAEAVSNGTVPPEAEFLSSEAQPPPSVMNVELGSTWLPGGYLIQPGDVLAIKFRVTSDLNEEVIVRPDGMIALHLIGDVMAAYITPEELAAALESAFKGVLRDPQLSVIVRTFAGNQVYVGGEVQIPGGFALTGRLTTLQAIIQAGGFRDTADRRHIIIRRSGGGSEIVDLHGEIHGRKLNQDIQLQPYDVVYVPKSRIAKANLFVDQYINRVIPIQRSFGYFLSASSFNAATTTLP